MRREIECVKDVADRRVSLTVGWSVRMVTDRLQWNDRNVSRLSHAVRQEVSDAMNRLLLRELMERIALFERMLR